MERLFVYKSERIIHMETNMTAKNSVVTISSHIAKLLIMFVKALSILPLPFLLFLF